MLLSIWLILKKSSNFVKSTWEFYIKKIVEKKICKQNLPSFSPRSEFIYFSKLYKSIQYH